MLLPGGEGASLCLNKSGNKSEKMTSALGAKVDMHTCLRSTLYLPTGHYACIAYVRV